MVKGLRERNLHLVSELRSNAVLWGPYTGLPRKGPGRPRKYAGRFDRADISALPAIDLPDEGRRLHPAQLYYKPFQCLLQVVFVLDADANPEMEPERIYRIHRDRFQIEFNFRDAKLHLGLAACQARHHFRVNAVIAALAWIRLELRHAADRVLERFSMVNVKLKSFLELVLNRLFDTDGLGRTLQKPRKPCRPCSTWAKSSRNRPESTANPLRIRRDHPIPASHNPGQDHRDECFCPCISRKLFTPL